MDQTLSRDKGRIQTFKSHFLYTGQSQRTEAALEIQKEGENRSTRTFKVVQSGSKVSLPTVTSIPCVAVRLKNCVSNWETITSDQGIFEAIRGVTIDFFECPAQVGTNLIRQKLR